MNRVGSSGDEPLRRSVATVMRSMRFLARPVNVASPLLLNLILFLYFIALPFYLTNKRHEYYAAIFLATIGFISLNIALLINSKNIEHLTPKLTWGQAPEILLIIFIAFDILKIFNFLLHGVSQSAYSEDYGKVKGWNLYFLLAWAAFGFCKYYFYSIIIAKNQRVFWLIFLVSLLAAFPGRARFEIISTILFFVIFGSIKNYIRLKSWHIFAGIIISPILMLLLLIKRNIIGDFNLPQVFNLIFDNLINLWRDADLSRELLVSMEAPATFEIFNQVVNDNFVRPENGVLRVFFNFIPRELWPDKPLPMQIELARAYNPSGFEAGGGVFAGIYGDAYANAGMIGVILMPFLVGLLLNKSYKNAITKSQKSSVNIGLYSVLVIYFANFYRGYFSDMTWQIILLYGVFWILNKFNNNLVNINNLLPSKKQKPMPKLI
jgi:hypothetical protein